MSLFSFKMPDLGEGIVEVELLKWAVKVGDRVSKDQPIADVMTDKANVELTSPVTGLVLKLACDANEMVAVGAELIRFEIETENSSIESDAGSINPQVKTASTEVISSAGTEKEALSKPARIESSVKNETTPEPEKITRKNGRVLASPAVRRRAREHGIELSMIAGSGSAGQVTADDLKHFNATAAALKGKQNRSAVEKLKITGLRRVIAQKLEASKRSIPHFSYIEEIELDELEALRQHLNQNRQKEQSKLTLLPFIMQAMIHAVEKFPEINSTYDDEAGIVTRFAGVHVGIATQTEQGLKVPVIRHAEALDIWDKARKVQQLSEAARDNSIGVQELTGSTITITSLGKLGGISSTPILNKPEVAIIGINKAEDRVVAREGQMVIRRMMNISSSFDHRIIDGYVAAEFIQVIKSVLEHPVTLFMPEVNG